MDTTNLIAYLPFDTSTTEDKCGNTWTAYNAPTIVDNTAVFSGANQYLELDGTITLGGQDFTIAAKINLSSAAGSWIHIFNLWTSSHSDANKIAFQRNYTYAQCAGIFFGAKTNFFGFALDTVHHVEFDYSHDAGKVYIFVDGALMATINKTIAQTTFPHVYIGRSNYGDPYFAGTIDEFMIYDGVALHTENFTPPTDSDYADLKFALGEETAPVGYTFDVERTVINAQFFGTQWVQPVLTANGKIGVDEFAVSSSTDTANAYKAFDSSATSYVNKMNAGEWLEFYSKTPIRIFDIALKDGGGYLPAQGIFQVSYDGGETWTQAGTWTDSDGKGISAKIIWDSGHPAGQYFRLLSQARSIPYPNNNAGFYNIVITAWNTLDSPNYETKVFYAFDVDLRVTNTPNINEDTPPQISFSGSNNNYATLPEDVLPGATEFTIEAKFSTTSTKNNSSNYTWGTIAGREIGGYWVNDFGLCVNDGKLCFWAEPSRNGSNSTRNTTSDAIVNDGQIHTAAVRSNADGSIDLFCDGEIVAHTDNVNAKTPDTKNILVASNSDGDSALQMNLYEIRFWNTAREEIFADIDGTEAGLQGWYIPTENGLTDYSPNIRNATITGTVNYSEVNTVFVDVDYESTNDALGWRYEDCAVYFGTGAPINFHVPPTAEIWVRFDVYFDGVSRWYAYDDGIYGMTGITAQTSLELDFLSAGSAVKTLPDICKAKVTQTYLLHMISGVADGLIEVWCGLNKIGTYTGNVNNGRQFADFKLRSDDIGTSFTELIISNSELQPDEKPANTVRATKTSQLNTCNTKTEKIWLDRGGDYPFPYLDLTTREVLRQLITETIEGEGEFSPITTIWLKFDVYFDGINRWSAYNISETNGKNGVFSDLPLDFSFLANDFEVVQGQSVLLANQWQTVIVHMESAEAPNGMIDVWIDGVQMHQYLGNVNNGEEFTNIYLTSEGGGTMFKNFIASSAPLTEDDTPQTVATGMGQLAFTVWHNGKVLTVPLKLSAVPITPSLTVRWQGCDWYNPLVLPSAENASEVAVRYNGTIYALSYF